ncbi:hypothetical protein AB9L11_07645 [Desulfovibrio piger]
MVNTDHTRLATKITARQGQRHHQRKRRQKWQETGHEHSLKILPSEHDTAQACIIADKAASVTRWHACLARLFFSSGAQHGMQHIFHKAKTPFQAIHPLVIRGSRGCLNAFLSKRDPVARIALQRADGRQNTGVRIAGIAFIAARRPLLMPSWAA